VDRSFLILPKQSIEQMTRAKLLDEIAARILRLELPHPTRVAIDGVDAAGKTTLADELVRPLEAQGRHVIRASVDGFHRSSKIRYAGNNDPMNPVLK
jgi:uridine kinase